MSLIRNTTSILLETYNREIERKLSLRYTGKSGLVISAMILRGADKITTNLHYIN